MWIQFPVWKIILKTIITLPIFILLSIPLLIGKLFKISLDNYPKWFLKAMEIYDDFILGE